MKERILEGSGGVWHGHKLQKDHFGAFPRVEKFGGSHKLQRRDPNCAQGKENCEK